MTLVYDLSNGYISNDLDRGGGAMGAYASPHQAKMVRVVEYTNLIITVSLQERLSPQTVEHSL